MSTKDDYNGGTIMNLCSYIGTVVFWGVCFITMKMDLKADLKSLAEKDPERAKIWQSPKRRYSSIAYIVIALFPIVNVVSGLAMTFGYGIIYQKVIESYEEEYVTKLLLEHFNENKRNQDDFQ